MSDHEYDYEPIPGLPEHLPAGERMLWQGSPDWRELALHVFHVRKMTLYFAVLLTANVAHSLSLGQSLLAAIAGSRGPFAFACIAIGVLLTLAWFSARATIYTLTDHRIVIRHGMALPMSVNLPFKVIDAVAVKAYANGAGEIAMRLARGHRIGYLLTWPHVRRWHVMQPQPSIRGIAEVKQVAQLLAVALSGMPQTTTTLIKPNAQPVESGHTAGTLNPARTAAA